MAALYERRFSAVTDRRYSSNERMNHPPFIQGDVPFFGVAYHLNWICSTYWI